MNSSKWITANLSYSGDRDQLLVECISPIINEVIQKGLSTQYFWVRNSEKGPNVRLRFKCQSAQGENEIKLIINKRSDDFFERKPSFRVSNQRSKNWFENDSITYTPYVPEVARYGGSKGMTIAEKQFQLSSRTVLNILNSIKALSTEERIKVSMITQILMFTAFDKDRSHVRRFFEEVHNVRWVKMPELIYKEQNMQNILPVRRKTVEVYFLNTKFNYSSFVTSIFDATVRGNLNQYPWMESWYQGMRKIFKELNDALIDDHLVLRKSWKEGEQPLWPMIESYCHMTHNRIGTRNLFEGYIAKVIADSL